VKKQLLSWITLIVLCAACSSKSNPSRSSTASQKDGSGAFTTKQYRNLFLENGHPQQQIDQKIDHAFQQLYHGDSATQKIYFAVAPNENGPAAYILDVNNNDIRSEGMSYGMMIAVQLNKKPEFDAIWNYAMSKMYVSDTAHPSEGYFAWSLRRDGTPNSETPAPDGEEYFVMSLYFAAHRWGNGIGIYNYTEWADKILTAIRHHPQKTGRTRRGNANVTVGPMVNEEKKMILFVPNGNGRNYSDPSYHLPAFYELWSRWGPVADRSFWAAAADTSREYFNRATHPVTGLAPDYGHFDGRPVISQFNQNSKHFAYDSWRTAMNWSVDWWWWRKDPRQQDLSNRIQTFFHSQGMNTYGSVYTLEGQVVNKGHGSGLKATNAVASLAATHAIARDFVEELWNDKVPQDRGGRYYSGLLHMMALLHCSGEFRIH
jgi:oligosaccharide reducing-end xylanase